MLVVRLFGPLEIEAGGRRLGPRDFDGVKPKQVLEILLAERGHPVARERIADLLWGEALPQNVTATLENYVSLVRRQLGREAIVTGPGTYGFAVERAALDVDRFDALVAEATRHDLEEALRLVRGEVLEDEPYGAWAVRLREAYRERHLEALLDAAETALAEADFKGALAHSEAAIARDAVRERAHRAAMVALYALGRQDEALRTFERCRAALADDLGVDPLPETVDLHAAMLRHVDAHALLPAVAARAVRVHPAAGMADEVPLLGRATELARLQQAATKALGGVAALVLVEGEAGIGKTRLLDELTKRLAVPAGRGKCFELDRDLPFLPLAEAVRAAAGPADPTRYPALGEILPELGPSGLPPEAARARALESLAALVRERAPLALVLDDLQWADASTMAALAYLQRRCAAVPLVVAGAFRSEDVGADHPLRRLETTDHLELQPLTADDVAALGVADLHGRTGGHPLFIVERLRAAAEGRPEEIPQTLREVIVARCRAAGAHGHRILVAASVLGRTFDPAVLVVMLDADPVELTEQLEALADRRLLRVAGERFDFRHDLIRETLLGGLSPARRRALHARALETLESAGAEPADLAHHAEAAGAYPRVVRYATAAGEAARARFANVEAAAHYGRARRVAAAHPGLLDGADYEQLLVRLGRVLVTIGRQAEAEAALHEARDRAAARGDDRALFEALDALVFARQRGASAPSDALAHARQALEVARRIGDDDVLSRAHAAVGSPSGSLGMIDDGLEHSRLALDHAARAGRRPVAYPMGRIALLLHHRAQDRDALDWTERAEAAAAEQHDEETLIMARWVRGLALAALGRYSQAWGALDSIADIGKGEEVFWHARVPNTYGALLAELCLAGRALERDLESLAAAESATGTVVREAALQTRLNVASDHLALGAIAEARANLERVRAEAADVEYTRYRYLNRLHALDAEIAMAEGDAERARAAAEQCLAMAGEYAQPKNEARGRVALAAALARLGEPAAAQEEARTGARLAEQLGYPGLAWRAWWTAFTVGGAAPDRTEAQAAVLRASGGLDEPLRAEFLAAVPVRP